VLRVAARTGGSSHPTSSISGGGVATGAAVTTHRHDHRAATVDTTTIGEKPGTSNTTVTALGRAAHRLFTVTAGAAVAAGYHSGVSNAKSLPAAGSACRIHRVSRAGVSAAATVTTCAARRRSSGRRASGSTASAGQVDRITQVRSRTDKAQSYTGVTANTAFRRAALSLSTVATGTAVTTHSASRETVR
jgi:hypothetical protein